MSTASERRNRHNVYTLVGALIASLAIVLVLVLVTVRPDVTNVTRIDWHSVRAATPSATALVDPEFTTADGDWWSNRAEYSGGDNPSWYIGFLTPDGAFVSIRQYPAGVASDDAAWFVYADTGSATIAGVTWSVIDRSAENDPGNDRIVLVATTPEAGSLVVSGTASIDELSLVAERALLSLKG